MTLLGILGHDRPEGLEASLRSVDRAGVPLRVILHLDDPDPGSVRVAAESGHQVLDTASPIGIGASLNRILAHRQPGEAFIRIDGDTEIVTDGWGDLMLGSLEHRGRHVPGWATISTVLRTWEGNWSRGVPPGPRVIGVKMGRGIGSVMVCRGDVCDKLGGFREGYPFAFEDTDWHARVQLGFRGRLRCGTDLRVVAQEAAAPSRKLWRFEAGPGNAPEAFREARAAFHAEQRPVFRPVPGEVFA